VYKEILLCRCSICNNIIGGVGVTPFKFGFTFSHRQCESKYCVHIPNQLMVGAPLMSGPQVINFQRHMDIDAVAAAVWVHTPFADLKALADKTSPMTQRMNDKAYGIDQDWIALEGSLKRWVRPHPLVADEDTLYGAAGITDEMEQLALQKADDARDEVRARADARRARHRAEEADAASAREGQLRVQLVMAKLPWHTPSALQAFSRHMLSAIRYNEFVKEHIGTPTQVMRMASYIADLLALPDQTLSQGTIDFFLKKHGSHPCLVPAPRQAWTFRGPAWRAHAVCFRQLVSLVESFDSSRFKLECLTSRNTREVQDPGWQRIPLPLLDARIFTTMFVVTTYWPNMREHTAQINVTVSDELLFRLRATTGLSNTVDLEGALNGLTYAGPVSAHRCRALESCATAIFGAALGTSERTRVLRQLGIPLIMQNLIENTLPEGW
jgi:hypothetical protein